jgi:hypothetical protein
MDIYCKRCGEPWALPLDMDADEKQRFMTGQGCPCCYGKPVEQKPFRALIQEALESALGDDLDGLAAEMEDAEYLLGESFWE